jgi:hypothetical protein
VLLRWSKQIDDQAKAHDIRREEVIAKVILNASPARRSSRSTSRRACRVPVQRSGRFRAGQAVSTEADGTMTALTA